MGNVHSARECEAAHRKKGFVVSVDGNHVFYRFLNKTGDVVVFTKISHGPKGRTLSAKLISDMARQCLLTKQQYLDFIDCKMSEEAYREILRQHEFNV